MDSPLAVPSQDGSKPSAINLAGFQALDMVCARKARIDKYERQASLRSTPGALEVLSQARAKHYQSKREPIRLGKLETERELSMGAGRRAHRPTEELDKEIEDQVKQLMSRVGELSSNGGEDAEVEDEDLLGVAMAERESSYRRNLFLQSLASRVASGTTSNTGISPGPAATNTKTSMPAIIKPRQAAEPLLQPLSEQGVADDDHQLSEPVLPFILGPPSRTSLSGAGAAGSSPTRQLFRSGSLGFTSRSPAAVNTQGAARQKASGLETLDEAQLEPVGRLSGGRRQARHLGLEPLSHEVQFGGRMRFSEAGGMPSPDRPSASAARFTLGIHNPGQVRARTASLTGIATNPLVDSMIRAAATSSCSGAGSSGHGGSGTGRGTASPARPGTVSQQGPGSRSSRVGAYLDFMGSEEAFKPIQLG